MEKCHPLRIRQILRKEDYDEYKKSTSKKCKNRNKLIRNELDEANNYIYY